MFLLFQVVPLRYIEGRSLCVTLRIHKWNELEYVVLEKGSNRPTKLPRKIISLTHGRVKLSFESMIENWIKLDKKKTA